MTNAEKAINVEALEDDAENQEEDEEESDLDIPASAYKGFSIAGIKIRRAAVMENGLFMALYGKGGSGKTTLASELYKLFKTLLIDAEAGTDVLEDLRDEENLDIADVESWSQFEKLVSALKTDVRGYGGIIVDNYSELLDQCENHFGIVGGDRNDLMKYNLVTKAMRRSMKTLRGIARKHKIIVILIFWDADTKDGERIKKDLSLTPKLKETFPGICTMIGHLEVGVNPDARTLSFAPSPRTVSKFKRSRKAAAQKVPYEITYKVDNLPLVDIINTIQGRGNWPSNSYEKPKRNTSASE